MGFNMIVEWRGMSMKVNEWLILKYKEYRCDVLRLMLLIEFIFKLVYDL